MTPKQEQFVRLVAEGASQSDAYRQAFNAANMKDATIRKRASELMRHGAVKGMLRELRQEMAASGLWMRQQSAQALIGVVNGPEGAPRDVIAAVAALNKMFGYDAPEKHEVTGPEMPTKIILVASGTPEADDE